MMGGGALLSRPRAQNIICTGAELVAIFGVSKKIVLINRPREEDSQGAWTGHERAYHSILEQYPLKVSRIDGKYPSTEKTPWGQGAPHENPVRTKGIHLQMWLF